MPAPDMLNLEEFSRPVESIMMCEDFKSNFARKLSNRYISRTPVAKDTALKLPKKFEQAADNVSERIECAQLSKSVSEHSEAVKSSDKSNSDMRSTEVNALNMEIETLRWQLSQTEANRQMHISLLKQVVSFLSRVKEHIECQKPGPKCRKESMSIRLAPRSFNVADLPRCRSVVHMNKNIEFSLSSSKKMSTKKISKSISNVKDCTTGWSPSKLFPTPEEESTQKIAEEMTRLITLANTVLGTKLPDLACTNNDNNSDDYAYISETTPDDRNKNDGSISSSNLTVEDVFITTCDNNDTYTEIANDSEVINASTNDFVMSPSPLPISGLESDFGEIIVKNPVKTPDTSTKTRRYVENRSKYNHAANFIEDESGFSSMSSFQEIGIPIISIIPPSPCKEVGYMDRISDILEDTKWKSDPLDLDKQSVKVFWV